MPQVEALCNIGGGKIYADRLTGAAGGKFGVAVAKQFAQIVEILAGAVEEIEISADGFDTFKFGIAAEKRAQRLCDCIRARAQRFGKPEAGEGQIAACTVGGSFDKSGDILRRQARPGNGIIAQYRFGDPFSDVVHIHS